MSGHGRELGASGLEGYTEAKTVRLDILLIRRAAIDYYFYF